MDRWRDIPTEDLVALRAYTSETRKPDEDTPQSERRWVTRHERYDYPIGIDPEGHPYPVPPPREEE